MRNPFRYFNSSTAEHAVEIEVDYRRKAIAALNASIDIGAKAMERARIEQKQAKDGEGRLQITSFKEMAQVVSAVVEVYKQIEVLTGGVSDRIDVIDGRANRLVTDWSALDRALEEIEASIKDCDEDDEPTRH